MANFVMDRSGLPAVVLTKTGLTSVINEGGLGPVYRQAGRTSLSNSDKIREVVY